MVLVITLVLLYAAGTISRHSQGYSWYSTIDDFKMLMREDDMVLGQLETRITTESFRINSLLSELTKLHKAGKMMMIQKHFNKRRLFTSGELLTRYQARWKQLVLDTRSAVDQKFVDSIHVRLKTFPREEDIVAAFDALLDLQEVYGLSTTDLADGIILGQYCCRSVSLASRYDLASRSCQRGNIRFCQEWADATAARLKPDENTEITMDHLYQEITKLKEKDDFNVVCLNAALDQNVRLSRSNLKCSLWDNYHHPWLILQPVQMEQIAQSPEVVVFYNVISDMDIEYVKRLASNNLQIAKTLDDEKEPQVASVRVAHNCWLDSANDPTLSRLDRLVSAITGLNIDGSSELIQVANYGIAGHYLPHTDTFAYTPEEETLERNRKATFMFYLSDVEHGGNTAFLHSGTSVKPVKGSAVFWHNLLPSGAPDSRTVHGSCPVILGNKWVANKWIWETEQEQCKAKEYIGRIHY